MGALPQPPGVCLLDWLTSSLMLMCLHWTLQSMCGQAGTIASCSVMRCSVMTTQALAFHPAHAAADARVVPVAAVAARRV